MYKGLVGCKMHNRVDSYLVTALGVVEGREIIGLTISHNRHTQGFLH